MAKKRKHKTSPAAKGVFISLGTLLVLLFIIFIYFTIYFKTHFFWRTELNNLSVSGMTLEEARDKLKEEAASYLLTIYDRDGNKYHINAADIDYTYIPNDEEEQLLADQQSWKWIRSLFSAASLTSKTTVTYDENLLSAALSALPCFQAENITEPADAYIEKDEDGYTLVPDTPGTHMIFEQVLSEVAAAVSESETELYLTDEDYLAPDVTAENTTLTNCMNTINTYLNTAITYDIADEDEVLDRDTVLDWIQLEDDYSITINQTKLTAYVQSLASKYNTYGDVRNFRTSKGDVIQIGGGDYGWIIDKEKEADQILSDLASGTAVTREPVYQQRALYREADDIGNSYVEIDYTNQHLWYYKDGTLVTESDIVSGKLNNGNGSPDGVYKIVYKQSPAVLKGEDYESDVTYFMPFAYNIGIHDASWRSSFGGNIYKNSGSHGCINVPFECAAAIYETIDTGTPVIAYYREPVTLTSNSAKTSNAYSYADPKKETKTQ